MKQLVAIFLAILVIALVIFGGYWALEQTGISKTQSVEANARVPSTNFPDWDKPYIAAEKHRTNRPEGNNAVTGNSNDSDGKPKTKVVEEVERYWGTISTVAGDSVTLDSKGQ